MPTSREERMLRRALARSPKKSSQKKLKQIVRALEKSPPKQSSSKKLKQIARTLEKKASRKKIQLQNLENTVIKRKGFSYKGGNPTYIQFVGRSKKANEQNIQEMASYLNTFLDEQDMSKKQVAKDGQKEVPSGIKEETCDLKFPNIWNIGRAGISVSDQTSTTQGVFNFYAVDQADQSKWSASCYVRSALNNKCHFDFGKELIANVRTELLLESYPRRTLREKLENANVLLKRRIYGAVSFLDTNGRRIVCDVTMTERYEANETTMDLISPKSTDLLLAKLESIGMTLNIPEKATYVVKVDTNLYKLFNLADISEKEGAVKKEDEKCNYPFPKNWKLEEMKLECEFVKQETRGAYTFDARDISDNSQWSMYVYVHPTDEYCGAENWDKMDELRIHALLGNTDKDKLEVAGALLKERYFYKEFIISGKAPMKCVVYVQEKYDHKAGEYSIDEIPPKQRESLVAKLHTVMKSSLNREKLIIVKTLAGVYKIYSMDSIVPLKFT